jgi:hypothetical protein
MPAPNTGVGTTGSGTTSTGSGTSSLLNATQTGGLLSVGPDANPKAYAPNPSAPIGGPDSTKGNVAGVWGFAAPFAQVPSQTSSPPDNCGVFGQAGVGFTPSLQVATNSPNGSGVLGYGGSHGVLGIATDGNGVRGVSNSSYGISGASDSSNGVYGVSTTAAGVYGTSTSGNGVSGSTTGTSTSSYGVVGSSTNGAGVCGIGGAKGLAGLFQGNVEISGDITSVNTITVKTDVVLTGADCAEQFDIEGTAQPEPGTILVIDDEGKLRESSSAYDRRVAGVVSGAGDFRPGIVLDRQPSSQGRATIALVGKVYCKADADPAPIQVGDLLTTSPRPGYAMKAANATQAFGAVIGKALRPLSSGQGTIPILVALQ